MNGRELAAVLRERQIEETPELVKRFSKVSLQQFVSTVKTMLDGEIVLSYITCSNCGRQETSLKEALALVAECENVDEWFGWLDWIGGGC